MPWALMSGCSVNEDISLPPQRTSPFPQSNVHSAWQHRSPEITIYSMKYTDDWSSEPDDSDDYPEEVDETADAVFWHAPRLNNVNFMSLGRYDRCVNARLVQLREQRQLG